MKARGPSGVKKEAGPNTTTTKPKTATGPTLSLAEQLAA